jgi:hypothetical protein
VPTTPTTITTATMMAIATSIVRRSSHAPGIDATNANEASSAARAAAARAAASRAATTAAGTAAPRAAAIRASIVRTLVDRALPDRQIDIEENERPQENRQSGRQDRLDRIDPRQVVVRLRDNHADGDVYEEQQAAEDP